MAVIFLRTDGGSPRQIRDRLPCHARRRSGGHGALGPDLRLIRSPWNHQVSDRSDISLPPSGGRPEQLCQRGHVVWMAPISATLHGPRLRGPKSYGWSPQPRRGCEKGVAPVWLLRCTDDPS